MMVGEIQTVHFSREGVMTSCGQRVQKSDDEVLRVAPRLAICTCKACKYSYLDVVGIDHFLAEMLDS